MCRYAGGHGASVAPLMTLLPDVVDLMSAIAHESGTETPTPVLAAGAPFTLRLSVQRYSTPLTQGPDSCVCHSRIANL